MLVLRRKRNEVVELRDRDTGRVICTVMVVEFRGDNAVRLGFEAPPEVVVHRGEVWAELDKARKQ